ncbi:hypothetical protein HAX54_044296, partial [Datura stramonium]|nr:hypothetical protein [Datura stramonium]
VITGTHEKVRIEEPSLDKLNPKMVKIACPMEQVNVVEDSNHDIPSLFDENVHDFYDSPIFFNETHDFREGLSHSESGCDSLTFDSPLHVGRRMKICDQENLRLQGEKGK